EYNRLVLSRYLTAPLIVDVAVNGHDAVDAAVACRPDVILMDVEMPGMDGLEAAREVRQRERDLKRSPCTIIALSSYDDEVTRRNSEEAGCNLYLTKPITRNALHAALNEFAHSRDLSDTVLLPPKPVEKSLSPDHVIEVDSDLKDVLVSFVESRRQVL